jgi:hypothetical protein
MSEAPSSSCLPVIWYSASSKRYDFDIYFRFDDCWPERRSYLEDIVSASRFDKYVIFVFIQPQLKTNTTISAEQQHQAITGNLFNKHLRLLTSSTPMSPAIAKSSNHPLKQQSREGNRYTGRSGISNASLSTRKKKTNGIEINIKAVGEKYS